MTTPDARFGRESSIDIAARARGGKIENPLDENLESEREEGVIKTASMLVQLLVVFVASWTLSPHAPQIQVAAGQGFRRCASALAAKGSRGADLSAAVAEIEKRAVSAAEAWDSVATAFLDPALADAVEARIGTLADVAAVRVGGRPDAKRARFVLTNPELASTVVPTDYATLYKAEADFHNSGPLANILAKIGVEPALIGDVLIDGEDTAYLVVAADAAKQVKRLLPKELRIGSGGAVKVEVHDGEAVEGELQPLDVQRLDKRLHPR